MKDPVSAFHARNAEKIEAAWQDEEVRALSERWIRAVSPHEYCYHFQWMGRPIIQYPQDIMAMQELIWEVKPDLIIETGVAHGGALVLYASMMQLLGRGSVLGIDIEIRPHNRKAIEEHPMFGRIELLEGSSTDPVIVAQVQDRVKKASRVMVTLDSMHTHDHVLRELELYAPFVTKNSYLVVFDTIVETMPEGSYPDRPWSRGDNPLTAVRAFLAGRDDFVVDEFVEKKLLVTVAPGGYLKRVG